MLFSADYSEFLQSSSEVNNYHEATTPTFMEGKQFLQADLLHPHHDFVYSQFTDTIAKRLFLMPYPSNFKNINPYCPLCLRLVTSSQHFSTCYLADDRSYLIHWDCLEKDKNYQMRPIGQVLDNVAVAEDTLIMKKRTVGLGMDARKFYAEVCFSHPIHDRNFIKLKTRGESVRNQLMISFNEEEEDIFYPNIVVLPLTDFLLGVNMVEFGPKGNKVKHTKYISLRNMREKKRVNIKCEEVHLSAEIIQDKEEQLTLLNKMNYKYKFEAEGMAMIRILNISIKLPQDMEDSDEEEIFVHSSTNIEILLKQKQPSIVSTIKSSSQSPVKPGSELASSGELILEGEKVNLDTLISTNGLIDYVKNNIQSRHFQNFLNDCSQVDLDKVINYIKEYLVELIMHQYGNYMVQKLFKVCAPRQRLDILQSILPNLCDLAKNKQGTHTIQAFISEFQLDEQFGLVYMQIGAQYYQLCRNNNATHLIQKIIKTFPLKYTIHYYNYTVQNLLAFALDKNAMCVIKHMIRQFRSIEGREGENYQYMEQIRKQLINNVMFNVDRLIVDCYGNYVIQFCYELFQLDKCMAITERILSKFVSYAVGKFSSNVILKCISIYWTDHNIYNTLKGLPSHQVVDIFKNKDGNKILLQIMEKLEGTELWDRLYSILIRQEPTRFYHDRWGVCLGSRSNTQMARNINFPQPRYKKRKAKQSIQ